MRFFAASRRVLCGKGGIQKKPLRLAEKQVKKSCERAPLGRPQLDPTVIECIRKDLADPRVPLRSASSVMMPRNLDWIIAQHA